jgi:hypothetical protein
MWEALAIEKEDREVFRLVVQRECGIDPGAAAGGGGRTAQTAQLCPDEVDSQARSMAASAVDDGERMLSALRTLLDGMRQVDAPKSLLLVTEGFVLDDRRSRFSEVERLAAEARTSLYALRLDQRVVDLSLERAPSPGSAGMDRMALREGLDVLVAATRGSVFTVMTTPDSALQSVEHELSGYYLLGIETGDQATEPGEVSVSVSRPGLTVRTRRRAILEAGARTARELAARALASPLPASGIPINVGAVVLGGQERGKVQLLIRSEVGAGYTAPAPMLVGYLLIGEKGQIVESRGVERVLRPALNGVPSALEYSTTISIDPGEYTLRFTATDGQRVGSVERSVRARLIEAGSLRWSDLVAGGPVQPSASLQPAVTSSVAFGYLHAFVEAYGGAAAKASLRYEAARAGDARALVAGNASLRPAGIDRAIFTQVLPVKRLPPGRYTLRAIVRAPACAAAASPAPACTLTTEFAIPAPRPGDAAETYLPVANERLAQSFAPAGGTGNEAWNQVDRLLANRQFGSAREQLEQMRAASPDDWRVAKPLALLYATLGRAVDAIGMLQRHLAAHPADVDALGLAVEWVYVLDAAGQAEAAHRDLARQYAAAYQKANGPELALVQLWMEHIALR